MKYYFVYYLELTYLLWVAFSFLYLLKFIWYISNIENLCKSLLDIQIFFLVKLFANLYIRV